MSSLLEVDREQLRRSFAKEPMAVGHHLQNHPLLQLDRIAALADSLPEDSIEHNLGKVPDVLPGGEAPKLDASPGEIARGIESNGSWMVLKRVEQDPAYKELLDASLDEVIPHVADTEGGAKRKEGFIFLSAPNSTTPAHIDPEHNLLLQVQGAKVMTVGRFDDLDAEMAALERYYSGGHRNLEGLPPNPQAFPLGPGDGVYMPVHAPHVVHNGPDASISFSITFYTDATERAMNLYSVNARLRRLGLTPRHPGARPGADRAKAGAWAGMRRGRSLVKKVIPGR